MYNAHQVSLREATDADSELAYAVKKAAFSEYVKKQYGDWREAEQRDYHRERFASQDFRVITADGHTVGIMAVVTEAECIKVNQLMIQPEHQGKGIGEQCMALIKDEAHRQGVPVRLQVMKVNPRALEFYRRIGFAVVGETESHFQMDSAP